MREKLTEVEVQAERKPERSFKFPEGHKSCGVGRSEPIAFDPESKAFRRSSAGHFAQ